MHLLVKAFAVLGLIGVARALYRLFAPRAEGELPTTLVNESRSDRIDLLSVVGRHLTRSATTGNQVQLLVNGERIFPAMLDAIEAATHSVHLLTYVYWQGDIAVKFADALCEAVQRGVRVRLLVDAYGGHPMDRALIRRVEEAGVTFAWFHPLRFMSLHRANLRTHRKVLVVDSTVAFVGGVGIAEEWTGDARAADEWRDNHFRVTGPAVHAIEGAFTENWLNATGELLVVEDSRPNPTIQDETVAKGPQEQADDTPDDSRDEQGSANSTHRIDGDDGRRPATAEKADPTRPRQKQDASSHGRVVTLATSSRGDLSAVAFVYWAALTTARKTVDIATPYFVPAPGLMQAIERTARRGVRVRLLLPGDNNDSTLVRWGSLAHYPALLEAGVEVHEFLPTMTHSKSMVVDARWSIVGSANFDNRSFELNDEIVLLIDDHALAAALEQQFERDLQRAQRIAEGDRLTTSRVRRQVCKLALLLHDQL